MPPSVVELPDSRNWRDASGGLPVAHIRTMEETYRDFPASENFNMLVLTTFGCAALWLAAIGIAAQAGRGCETALSETASGVRVERARSTAFRPVNIRPRPNALTSRARCVFLLQAKSGALANRRDDHSRLFCWEVDEFRSGQRWPPNGHDNGGEARHGARSMA